MLKNGLVIIIILALVTACRPPQEEDEVIPANILGDEQLTKVLTDAYLCEGASGINVKNVPGNKFDSAYAFNPLKDNGVTKAQFDSSIAYYSNHPKKLKIIYEKVLDKLSQIQAAGTLDK